MITGKTTLYIVCSLLGGLTTCAYAADNADQVSVLLGLGARSAPEYSGSNKQKLQPVPIVQIRNGAFFFDPQKGLGYDIQSDSGFYLEQTLGYSMGRADKNSTWRDGADRLKGMGNIDATVNTGLAVGWAVSSWLTLEARTELPLSDSQGVNYRTSVTLIPVQNTADTLVFQASALFGDSRYMATWYGVTEKQSRRSGFTTYSPDGGFYGTDTNLTWSHQFGAHWGTTLVVGYTWLDKHASKSPLVFQHNEANGVAAVTYAF